jgi:hypothetical protein
MEYLMYRELILPMDPWLQQVQSARNAYAKKHQLAERALTVEWGKLPEDK